MATNADDSASSHCGNDRTKWTDDETRAVIRLWQDHLPDLRRAKRNHHVYARIAERLVALGIEKTVKEVKKKIENLGNLFRFHNRTGTTTGKGAIKWRFFREINVFLGKLDKNNRELVQESRCGPSAAPAAAAASPVQILDEQRQLRCSLEQRRDRELELREQHLQFMQRQEEREEKLLDLLGKLCDK
ncbi:hypothetical protein HPB48_007197 [Haemaphysalis longicornis]|uniref:Myb/SANT-like DNA-binding domain-containing protein n=1 Tax=Haemaphysalis longicornis TaxID=44386 RepID=A0A9J6G2X0_HAELO|nr:hypothetical protein HPB48_007197 [Haemaphysalis longicornis]